METPSIKDFKKARTEFEETVEAVANKFDVSRTWIYEVLKYPNKDPELIEKIKTYCVEAELLASNEYDRYQPNSLQKK